MNKDETITDTVDKINNVVKEAYARREEEVPDKIDFVVKDKDHKDLNKNEIQIFLRRNIGCGMNDDVDIYAIIGGSHGMSRIGNISMMNNKLYLQSFSDSDIVEYKDGVLKNTYNR